MKRRMLTISLISLAFFFVVGADAASAATPYLSIGTTSPKVRILQQILNVDSDTVVAQSGAGSPGFETEYFGSKTLTALIKFQRKYYAQIGMQSPDNANGIVDELTKKFLNSLLTTAASSVQAKASSTIAYSPQIPLTSTTSRTYLDSLISEIANRAPSSNMISVADLRSAYAFASTSKSYIDVSDPAVAASLKEFYYKTIEKLEQSSGTKIPVIKGSNKVIISGLSKSTGAPGDLLRIYGKGFSLSGNAIYFNNQKIDGIASNSLGTIIDTAIPQNVYGPVQVAVESNGEKSWPAGIIVAKAGAVAPKIYISQSNMKVSDVLTIYGTGFAKTNTIYSSIGQIDNILLSSTTTLQIKLTDLPGLAVWKNRANTKPITTSIFLWVANENGISDLVGPIVVKI